MEDKYFELCVTEYYRFLLQSIRNNLEYHNLSQRKMALDLGLDPSNLHKILIGRVKPSPLVIIRMMHYLGMLPIEFIRHFTTNIVPMYELAEDEMSLDLPL